MREMGWKKWIYRIFVTGIMCLLFSMPVSAANLYPTDEAIEGGNGIASKYAKIDMKGYIRTIENPITTGTYDFPAEQTAFTYSITPLEYHAPNRGSVGTGLETIFPEIKTDPSGPNTNNVTVDPSNKQSAIVKTDDLPAGQGEEYDSATDVTTPPSPSEYKRQKSATGNLFIDFTGCKTGVYTYVVTQQSDSVLGVHYDSRIYYINVYVVEQVDKDDDNAGTGKVYVASMTAFQNTNGSDVSGTGPDVDPSVTPSTNLDDETSGKAVKGENQLEVPFVNLYPVNQLIISKTVTGNYASLDKYFKFEVRLFEGDSGNSTPISQSGINYGSATAPTVPITYYNKAGGKETVFNPQFTSDTSQITTIYLRSGQHVVINSLPNGTKYEIKEVVDDSTYDLAYINTRAVDSNNVSTQNTTLGSVEPYKGYGVDNPQDNGATTIIPQYVDNQTWIYVDPENSGTDNQVTGTIAGEVSNVVQIEADYVNDRVYIPPTEMLLHYWPYVVAVAVVVLLLLVFLIKKIRGTKKPKDGDGL